MRIKNWAFLINKEEGVNGMNKNWKRKKNGIGT